MVPFDAVLFFVLAMLLDSYMNDPLSFGRSPKGTERASVVSCMISLKSQASSFWIAHHAFQVIAWVSWLSPCFDRRRWMAKESLCAI